MEKRPVASTLLSEEISVSFWRLNDRITGLNRATLDDFGYEASSIEERLLEALLLAREFAWSCARVAVFHSTKTCSSDLELSADEPHQLDALDEDVAATVLKLEAASIEEDSVHEGNLAVALPALVEAAFAGRVAVALEALARDRLRFRHLPHRSACGRADADCGNCSVHVLVLSFLKI